MAPLVEIGDARNGAFIISNASLIRLIASGSSFNSLSHVVKARWALDLCLLQLDDFYITHVENDLAGFFTEHRLLRCKVFVITNFV